MGGWRDGGSGKRESNACVFVCETTKRIYIYITHTYVEEHEAAEAALEGDEVRCHVQLIGVRGVVVGLRHGGGHHGDGALGLVGVGGVEGSGMVNE